LVTEELTVQMMAWGGQTSVGSHCIDSATAIAIKAEGGVIEECGHWVFQEKTDFICNELDRFWRKYLR
jgi:pimeloyl-ACP methyl ester carboxylesterase